jgi:hypothetical protein
MVFIQSAIYSVKCCFLFYFSFFYRPRRASSSKTFGPWIFSLVRLARFKAPSSKTVSRLLMRISQLNSSNSTFLSPSSGAFSYNSLFPSSAEQPHRFPYVPGIGLMAHTAMHLPLSPASFSFILLSAYCDVNHLFVLPTVLQITLRHQPPWRHGLPPSRQNGPNPRSFTENRSFKG